MGRMMLVTAQQRATHMRYQESVQQTQAVYSVSTDMMVGTAVYTLFLGVAFVIFGMRVRKRWVSFWGATMVLAGAAYIVAIIAGFD